MAGSTTRAIAVRIDHETRERINRLAQSRRRTSHWIMREAISQYLEREEERASIRQNGIDAWKENKATGLHVAGDEVTTWLESWGDENESPAPLCRK